MNLANKTIVVTGGHGFLGRHVVAKLQEHGPRGIVSLSHRDCDLTERDDASDLIRKYQPDLVVHLAARVGGIGYNQARPGELIRDNLLMAVHLFDAVCYHRGAECPIVSVGTVCSYPKITSMPIQESYLWDGYPEETNAPYGVAKRALVELASAYAAQYGMQAMTLIPTNLYGPGDHFEESRSHVIPALIKRFIEAKRQGASSVTVWGTGAASRDFLYVEDAAAGIVQACASDQWVKLANLGTSRETSMRDLAAKIADATGYEGSIEWDASKPDGQPRRCVSTCTASLAFGWQPTTDLETGLRQTVEWYLSCAS